MEDDSLDSASWCSDNLSNDDEFEMVKDDGHNAKCEILTTDEIVQEMNNHIAEINRVIEMPETTTRILLSHCKWDTQGLLEKLTGNDRDDLFEKAHVLNPFKKSPRKKTSRKHVECIICYSKFIPSLLVNLGCGHYFCKDCCAQYLKVKIIEEGESDLIRCLEYNCGLIFDDVTVMNLLQDDVIKTTYKRLMANSFVQHKKSLRWCPSRGCSNAIKISGVLAYRLGCTCTCGFESCFGCGEEAHDPLTCDLIKKWYLNGDHGTLQYLSKNTKPCPNCQSQIEKNGGCDHMTCKKCQHSFCWICLVNWNQHKACNSYKAEKKYERNQYSRWKHYFDRYDNHKVSLTSAKTFITTAFTTNEGEKANWAKEEKDAMQIWLVCRKELMLSYIFAYYLKDCHQKEIFEMNQRDLEETMEKLSQQFEDKTEMLTEEQHLEQNIENGDVAEIKKKIINIASYCSQRRERMEDHIYEGYGMSWWSFD